MNRRDFLRLGCHAGLLACAGCAGDMGLLLPPRKSDGDEPPLDGHRLLARFAQVTDTHLMDEESPARFAGAHNITHSAWRPYEAYSTQLLDGIIRTVNRIHASGRTIDFLLHTGDACDNAQSNELAWLLAITDGSVVDPLTGPDDRRAADRPPTLLDPHAPFQPQGLYRQGVHGDAPTIPWYGAIGNHDVHAIGVFPIVETAAGRRIAPLPLPERPGLVLPVVLDPLADRAYGNVTPAEPGPPCFLETPRPIVTNPARAYFNKQEYVSAVQTAQTSPTSHGFANGLTRYSTAPVPGLRLIVLDTTDSVTHFEGGIYDNGALTWEQLRYLESELDRSVQNDEVVMLATHHPSVALHPFYGSEILSADLQTLLGRYPNAVLHVAGHRHRNHVVGRGSYIEIETCSTLDLPQEGRLIELWQDEQTGAVQVIYEMFSHLPDDTLPPVGDDPLRSLREQAQTIAKADASAPARQRRLDSTGATPAGQPADRQGVWKTPSGLTFK